MATGIVLSLGPDLQGAYWQPSMVAVDLRRKAVQITVDVYTSQAAFNAGADPCAPAQQILVRDLPGNPAFTSGLGTDASVAALFAAALAWIKASAPALSTKGYGAVDLKTGTLV